MAVKRRRPNRTYGFDNALQEIYPRAIVATRAPTGNDLAEEGQVWIDKTNDDAYFLTSMAANSATWINAGGGSGVFTNITASGTITFSGLALGVVLSSASGVLSNPTAGTNGQLLIAGTGVAPAWAAVTSGDGSVVITGGSNTLDLQVSGATASTFPTDGGTATPALGATTIAGGTNITTSGAAATVTISLDSGPSIAGGFTITDGTSTITSDTNAAQAIYLHANGGSNETIDLTASQGTGANSLNFVSTAGGVTINAGLGSADAININASNAAGGIDIDSGTNGFIVDTTGAISLDAAAASNLTATGAFDVTVQSTAGSVIVAGGEAAADAIQLTAGDAAGGIAATAGTGGISLAATNGTVAVTSGTAAINIGTDAVAHTVTVGSTTGAASTVLQTGTGAMTFTAGGVFDVNAVGAVTIDSTGGALGLGTGADAQAINIGTGAAARTITVGNNTGATSVVVDCGTGAFNLGITATDHTTQIGSTTGTSAFTAQAGTGAMTFTAGGVFDVNGVGNVTIDSTGGTLGFGEGADNNNVNIGTGGTRTVTVGATGGASATTIQAGSGAVTVTAGGAFDLNAVGNVTIDSTGGTLGIGEGADANAINVGTGGAARTITVGNVTGATAVNVNAGTGGINLDANSTGNIQMVPATNSAAGASITLNARVGVVTLTGNTTAAGAQEAITLTNSYISATSGILLTVANVGANDARMTLEQVKPAAGSATINLQNNGAAALNGDIIIAFHVLN